MKHIVYKTYNPSTSEFYFGKHSTEDIYDGYQGSGRWVMESNRKDLITNHLYFADTEELAFELEEFLISLHEGDTLMRNLAKGGNQMRSRLGTSMPESAKKKISEFRTGTKQSEETKKRKSESLTGKKRTAEYCKKQSERMKGVPKFTEEGKKHLRMIRSGLGDTERAEIKKRYQPNVRGLVKALAEEYGVSRQTIRKIAIE